LKNGSAFTWLNYGTGIDDDLQELAAGFGCYYELGNTWNVGFYPTDDWLPLPAPAAPYSQKLKDQRC
jgi:hypothetical protein